MKLPLHLSPQELSAIEQAVRELIKMHQDDIRFIGLFGSKARGDFDPDSDIDLLIITESDDWQTRDEVRNPVFDSNMDHGLYISPRVIGLERLHTLPVRRPGFFQNLQRDAIELWRRPGTEDPLRSLATLAGQ